MGGKLGLSITKQINDRSWSYRMLWRDQIILFPQQEHMKELCSNHFFSRHIVHVKGVSDPNQDIPIKILLMNRTNNNEFMNRNVQKPRATNIDKKQAYQFEIFESSLYLNYTWTSCCFFFLHIDNLLLSLITSNRCTIIFSSLDHWF